MTRQSNRAPVGADPEKGVRIIRVFLGMLAGGVLGLLSGVVYAIGTLVLWDFLEIEVVRIPLVDWSSDSVIFFSIIFVGALMGGLSQLKPDYPWLYKNIAGGFQRSDARGCVKGFGDLLIVLVVILIVIPLVWLAEVIRLAWSHWGRPRRTRNYTNVSWVDIEPEDDPR